jgi:hypothetical protein
MSKPLTARPLTVIESDIHVTTLGLAACRRVTQTLLDARYRLLSEGWPDSHALCKTLDEDAARWAAHAEQMRRSLADLRAEANRDDCGAVAGSATPTAEWVTPAGDMWQDDDRENPDE